MASELNEKVKTIIHAINARADFVFDGSVYTVSGFSVTQDDGKLNLSIRLTDKTAQKSWLWIDERVYFKENIKI